MDTAMNQWNLDTNNIDKKLVRLKWNRYGILGRDIWRQYYGIGRWEQVQEIF
jgi:hypothetical protein